MNTKLLDAKNRATTLRWAILSAVVLVAIIAGAVIAGLHGTGLIAFLLGSIVSSGLSIGLMAATFHSSDGGYDDAIRRVDVDKPR